MPAVRRNREAYTLDDARKFLPEIPGWQLHDDGKVIYQQYNMKNFMAAIDFINEVAKIAEGEDHHQTYI